MDKALDDIINENKRGKYSNNFNRRIDRNSRGRSRGNFIGGRGFFQRNQRRNYGYIPNIERKRFYTSRDTINEERPRFQRRNQDRNYGYNKIITKVCEKVY